MRWPRTNGQVCGQILDVQIQIADWLHADEVSRLNNLKSEIFRLQSGLRNHIRLPASSGAAIPPGSPETE